MPNLSGIWTVTQQMQARGASTWPATPGAPTIGTATAGVSLCASVSFCAPSCIGFPALTDYRVISTPGCFTQTGASSPLTVTGLTLGTSYTFKVRATNATGNGSCSSASNSITATQASCARFLCAGTYTWIAPAGVTSVAAVVVGGGGGVKQTPGVTSCKYAGGGGGGLAYANAISVTPGTSYTVEVGARGVGASTGSSGGASYFINTSTVRATGGTGISSPSGAGGAGGVRTAGTGNTGGVGGAAGTGGGGGGGAAGYGGNGGAGGCGTGCNGGNGGAGGGGGGGGGTIGGAAASGAGGGGVGICGQGANGAGGAAVVLAQPFRGGGGSGGTGGGQQNSTGGNYGGGGGWTYYSSGCGYGGYGAVRIVWAVSGIRGTPSFPSTNVGP